MLCSYIYGINPILQLLIAWKLNLFEEVASVKIMT